jgi:hypothetical protein
MQAIHSSNPSEVGDRESYFTTHLKQISSFTCNCKIFSAIDYLNDFVQPVFLCHQFNLSWTYSFIQGALNVVMGNAPEIGDALLQSTQVLFPPILSCIYIFFSLLG